MFSCPTEMTSPSFSNFHLLPGASDRTRAPPVAAHSSARVLQSKELSSDSATTCIHFPAAWPVTCPRPRLYTTEQDVPSLPLLQPKPKAFFHDFSLFQRAYIKSSCFQDKARNNQWNLEQYSERTVPVEKRNFFASTEPLNARSPDLHSLSC